MNRSKGNRPPTPALKDREDGTTIKNRRTGRTPLARPEPEPVKPTDPLAGYDPFTPLTHYSRRPS